MTEELQGSCTLAIGLLSQLAAVISILVLTPVSPGILLSMDAVMLGLGACAELTIRVHFGPLSSQRIYRFIYLCKTFGSSLGLLYAGHPPGGDR